MWFLSFPYFTKNVLSPLSVSLLSWANIYKCIYFIYFLISQRADGKNETDFPLHTIKVDGRILLDVSYSDNWDWPSEYTDQCCNKLAAALIKGTFSNKSVLEQSILGNYHRWIPPELAKFGSMANFRDILSHETETVITKTVSKGI